MNRQELIEYIDNCIMLGNVVTRDDELYKNLFTYYRSYCENVLDSVFIDGFYVKMDVENKIHLVYYDGGYKELDLGDCIDVIDDYAFAYRYMHHIVRQRLVSIKGESVVYIGVEAFAESSVKEVDFPNVERIGYQCFKSSKVENVKFNKLNYIPNRAFSNSELKSIEGKEVTFLGDAAFSNCKNLQFVKLPNVEDVGFKVFEFSSYQNFQIK